jgi:hypothetical protein
MYGDALSKLEEAYGCGWGGNPLSIIKIGYQHYAVPKALAKELIAAAIDGTIYEVDSNYVAPSYQYDLKEEPIAVEYVLGTPMTKAQRAALEEKKAIANFIEGRKNGA